MFQDRTLFDLLVEFYQDYFDQNPLEAHRNPDGHIQFKDTGDPLIDKWEEQLAAGETPNFSEAFSEEQRAQLNRLRERGGARTRMGGSFKSVMDSMSQEAFKQGLHAPGSRGPATISKPIGRPQRSSFGDGTE